MEVPFNVPYLTGRELEHIGLALQSGHLSGDGPYTQRCHDFFQERFGYHRVFLTASATDALEMCALLCDLGPGDEVIIPSYTFVSTANAFALRGATIKFADNKPGHPNVGAAQLEPLITPRTKAIVVMHYAGLSCPMDEIMALAKQHNLLVVEDAAQAIGASYKGRPLGSIGDLACFSFHETKNIQCGQGGLAMVNNPDLVERAEYAWQKGTNRSKFSRGEVNKYRWVDLGSSYLPGESVAAMLWPQLEDLDQILALRMKAWNFYHRELQGLSPEVVLPEVPEGCEHNAHIYQLVLPTESLQLEFTRTLKEDGIHAHTHYLSLHDSPYFKPFHDGRPLPEADRLSQCLVRLPLYNGISSEQLEWVVSRCKAFFSKAKLAH